MKIVDYTATPEVLSWFRSAGVNVAPLLAMRRVPLLNLRGKGAIPRVGPSTAFRLDYPMPAFDAGFSRTFQNLMNTTATNLLAEGKLIRLAWSGGLDSTGALLALKQAGATAAQVEVYYTDESVAEYPAFLSFIQQNFTPVPIAQVVPVVSADSLWVTGEGGNQIFFPISAAKFARADSMQPWEDYFFADSDTHVVDSPAKTFTRALMAQCPFQITTMQQAQWWRAFNLHWQHIAYRQGTLLSETDFSLFAAGNRPFFMTALWQRWSMKRMSGNPTTTSYLMNKKPLKDYIHAVFPDQNYYDTKTAEGSYRLRIDQPYVRFESGAVPSDELQFRAMVAA